MGASAMNKIWVLIEALKKGKELSNKETWKNAAALTSIFSAFIGAALVFIPDLQVIINPAAKSTIINGLVEIVLVFNAYTHIATSKSVGIGNEG
jgi:hypothetical protein